ncbi:MAG: hypothetical protein ACLS8R_07890 [Anaeromassilibacillus sp.]
MDAPQHPQETAQGLGAVVATSLIEAGVDVDFNRVSGRLAGFHHQAAGRCNREGKRPVDESAVYIFRTEERSRPDAAKCQYI